MRKRQSFTTVELLVASALSGVLMVGVLHVIGSIQVQKVVAGDTDEADWTEDLLDLVYRDLTHAQSIQQRENQLVLVGYASLNHGGVVRQKARVPSMVAQREHHPVRITYSVREQGARLWLVRQQTTLDDPTNHNRWTELVSAGVRGLELGPVGQSSGTRVGAWMRQAGPVPDQVRLVVRPDQGRDGAETIEKIMVIR